MPLFTKLTPLEDGPIKEAVTKVAADSSFNLSEIYQADDSKRSTKQNAFMFGMFKHKVAIADTVLTNGTPDDVAAIIGHEIGHSKHRHILKLLFISQISNLLTLLSFVKVMQSDSIFQSFGFVDEKPFIIGIQLVSFFVVPVYELSNMGLNLISCMFEYQADEYSAKMGLKIDDALLKLCQENKAIVDTDPIYLAFNANHPTLAQRIDRIRKVQKKKE
ncbi:CAAX prenyl protease 1 isoform X2 [Histomonas meleagridis]|uniref:CAAX prenyl protease 1-like isoform X2 n=1 Tax=Histomonas meleagridis TaxID=135588 RepID=UPI003559F0D3|nr:CAAX prenyl protease 1 isoform X2 [Histomonas meleagridis]KAH0799921.1 CAAX prenyl protease 1-like isoform X2 [Histomonas meleagridis]